MRSLLLLRGGFLPPTLLSLLLLPFSHCHFSLTFPETRYPPFNFLDSQRTVAPCGVPKSTRSTLTPFKAGSDYTLRWRTVQSHPGEFHFRLLDSAGKALDGAVLGANNGSSAANFSDGQNAQSLAVHFPLECRNCTLLLERESADGLERGCAEVDIVKELPEQKRCLGNGRWEEGRCQCEKGFSGLHCEQRDDCTEDADCGSGGRCVPDGVARGQRVCFCAFGMFGANCERKSDAVSAARQCFAHTLETVIDQPGDGNDSSLTAYGLFDPSCYSMRQLNGQDRLHWRVVGNQLELLLDFHSTSWLALGWRPLNIPPACRLFPQSHSPDGHDEDVAKTSGFLREVLDWPLHPMDCVDVVMASVREGHLLHIEDMYSRDRSSPLRDAWLDGEESLSAAYGMTTEGGRTVVMFRRMIAEIEPTDHPLGPGSIFVIFAKGQPRGGDDFYADGQWKYHGDKGRGHLHVELVPAAQMARIRGPLIHLDGTTTEQAETTETHNENEDGVAGTPMAERTTAEVPIGEGGNYAGVEEEQQLLTENAVRLREHEVAGPEEEEGQNEANTSPAAVLLMVIALSSISLFCCG